MTIGLVVGLTIGCASDAPPLAFVFAGESNSGGAAWNTDALPGETGVRSNVQIMNLYSGAFAFEDLNIGFNNLVDHAGMSDVPAWVPIPPNVILVHGWELGLANAVDAGELPGPSRVHLIKTGQGASRIADWGVGGTYWNKFLQRTDQGKARLPASTQWIVWYSQGANDVFDGTPVATWKAATIAHLDKIKAQLPGCIIVMTQFQSNAYYSPAYQAAIEEIVAADPLVVTSVDTSGATTEPDGHWDYAGFRNVIVPNLLLETLRLLRGA